MRRFSLVQILALIALVALGLAGIRSGSPFWARAFFSLTFLVLLTAAVGALVRARPLGAWAGFAVFGWAFLAACFMPSVITIFNENSFGITDFVENAALFFHPRPATPPGLLPIFDPGDLNSPDPTTAAYAMAQYNHTNSLRNARKFIRTMVCLIMAQVGSALGRFIEARYADRTPEG